ncbi:MAG: hypothetical protein QM582_05590 [Micropruina sp.]|uniref:hypothetical protein n=1 Tax=Micropruina sp. TaxID=2737536 RepID=UPI0039E38F31
MSLSVLVFPDFVVSSQVAWSTGSRSPMLSGTVTSNGLAERNVVDVEADAIGALEVIRQVTVVESVRVQVPRAVPVPVTHGTAVPMAPRKVAPFCATTVTLAVFVTMQVRATHSRVGAYFPVPDTTSIGTVGVFHPTSPLAAWAGLATCSWMDPARSTAASSISSARPGNRALRTPFTVSAFQLGGQLESLSQREGRSQYRWSYRSVGLKIPLRPLGAQFATAMTGRAAPSCSDNGEPDPNVNFWAPRRRPR